MSTKQAFEDRFRSMKFTDHDAARAAIKKAPMVAEYVLEMMIESGVLEVTESGEIIGGTGRNSEAKSSSLAYVSKTWGSTWPKKEALIKVLKSGPKKFSEIQAGLEEMGSNCGHWTVIHATRFLLKTKEISKDGKIYQLSSWVSDDVVDDAKPDSDTQIMIDACLKVGGGYKLADVAEEIKKAYAKKGLTWVEKPGRLAGEIQELEEAGWIPVGEVEEGPPPDEA